MSEHDLYQPAWNFLGLPDALSSRERARGWLLPIPYESTTSYGAGTREGPAAIIAASRQVEQYDYEYGCEPVTRYGVHTTPPLALDVRSPEAMMGCIEEAVFGILSGRPKPEVLAILGGEHSISAGVARALGRVLPARSLAAVQVDAHADLREEYEGSPLSHACAARRILDVCPVFQIGIRNLSAGEEALRRRSRRVATVFGEAACAPRAPWLKDLASYVKGKAVYLTIDLDGLDPSIMPAVGTPEPGGISWQRMLEIVAVICKNAASVPVFDVVELAPIPGLRGPDFMAAKLVYKIYSAILMKPSARRG